MCCSSVDTHLQDMCIHNCLSSKKGLTPNIHVQAGLVALNTCQLLTVNDAEDIHMTQKHRYIDWQEQLSWTTATSRQAGTVASCRVASVAGPAVS